MKKLFLLLVVPLISFIYAGTLSSFDKPNKSLYRSTWMADFNNKSGLNLTNLIIPGVHHPGSYSFIDGSGNLKHAATQYMTIYDQLMFGNRYFDMRPQGLGNQVVSYHAGYTGASFDTLFKQFADFANGYNSLVVFGESPSVIKIEDDKFVMFYSSHRKMQRPVEFPVKKIKYEDTQRIYYKIGQFSQRSNSIVWSQEKLLSNGKNPSVANIRDKLLMVYQDSDAKLYYSYGKLQNNIELGLDKKQFGDGVTPTIASFGSNTFIEVNNYKNNLEYRLFMVDGNKILTTPSKEFTEGFNPYLLRISNNKDLLFYESLDGTIKYRFIIQKGNGVTISDEKTLEVSGKRVLATNPKAAVYNGDVVISYTVTKKDKYANTHAHRAFCTQSISNNNELEEKVFFDGEFKYPLQNTLSAAILVTSNNEILSFESDRDSLSNIWYQPLKISDSNIKLDSVKAESRAKELMILSLTHADQMTKKHVDYLAWIIRHYLGEDKLIGNNVNKKTSVRNLQKQGKQYLVFFGKDDSNDPSEGLYTYGISRYSFFWKTDGNTYRTWHDENYINSSYIKKLNNSIIARKKYPNDIYVLQVHTGEAADRDTINSALNPKENVSEDKQVQLMKDLINKYGKSDFNVIENNMILPEFTNYIVDLNFSK